MNTPAADDLTAIRRTMEYERGFQAGLNGGRHGATLADEFRYPDGCMDRPAWLEGYDEGVRLKPKEE